MGKHFSGEESIILREGTVIEDEEKLDARVEGLDGMRNTAVRSESTDHPHQCIPMKGDNDLELGRKTYGGKNQTSPALTSSTKVCPFSLTA